MQIAVVGTGYVGLVAGACFADVGHTVTCIDRDSSKISLLEEGKVPIFEPGLETLVGTGQKNERLFFTTSLKEAVQKSEVVFLAVGTPSLPTGEPDLQFLKQAAYEVGSAMKGYCLIVNKSTVPIGAHQTVADWIREKTSHEFDVVSNPEFLKEGSAVDDFLRPDRVIIGTEKDDVFEKMAELYAPFVRQGNPILRMDPISAEISKYACNSFLATRISFMNELSNLCEVVGGDIEKIRKGMTTDQRIGKHFLYAGVGYGGSCFPKDIDALLYTGEKNGVPLGIVRASREANQRQKSHLIRRVQEKMGNLKGRKFAVWGLAFKPNTDDVREAPALTMIQELIAVGAAIKVYDPVAMDNARVALGGLASSVEFSSSIYKASEGVDAILLVTEWNELRNPDWTRLKQLMAGNFVFDGRNIYSPESLKGKGFEYYGIGR